MKINDIYLDLWNLWGFLPLILLEYVSVVLYSHYLGSNFQAVICWAVETRGYDYNTTILVCTSWTGLVWHCSIPLFLVFVLKPFLCSSRLQTTRFHQGAMLNLMGDVLWICVQQRWFENIWKIHWTFAWLVVERWGLWMNTVNDSETIANDWFHWFW